jgi:uncharacterized protein YaaQ
MKLIMAIVSKDDSGIVQSQLTKAGYPVTKLATTGGFLAAGNTTFIIGVNDEAVETVLKIIEKSSSRRTETLASTASFSSDVYPAEPIEINVGGATIFVLNVERFEKL